MTKEQEEAIKECEALKKCLIIYSDDLDNVKSGKALETVLNMLKEKDEEIQFQKDINKTEKDRHKQAEKSLKGQIEKKDKMIDLILDFIYEIWCVCPVTTTHELDVYDFNVNKCADCEHLDKKCKSCLKQHFKRKAEEN